MSDKTLNPKGLGLGVWALKKTTGKHTDGSEGPVLS